MLLVTIAARSVSESDSQFARELPNTPSLLPTTLLVLSIGVAVDGLLFGCDGTGGLATKYRAAGSPRLRSIISKTSC